MGEVVAQKVTASTAAAAEEEKQPAVVMDEQLPIHVLVVDDCFLDRRIVSKLLLKASFKVTTVDSGKKALEVLGIHAADADPVDESSSTLDKVEKIDLILTDFCMPEMNGHDLLVAVKEHSEKKSTPVVIMSSEYNPQRITSCLDSGAEEFLQKPLKLKDMEKLRSYVRTETASLTRSGTKRKASIENNGSEKLPRMAGVAVA